MYKSLSNSGSNILAFGFTRDVSGAVLIAGASSAPEIFINLYATLFTEGDLGIGTIIGSSVFNILAIPAMCGFLSGPMVRKTVSISSSQVYHLIFVIYLRLQGYSNGLVAYYARNSIVFTLGGSTDWIPS